MKLNDSSYQFYPSHALTSNNIQSTQLERKGLDYFNLFFSVASGPKSMVLCGFEDRFYSAYQSNLITSSKYFVGASAGALRHVALISSLAYLDRNEHKNITLVWKDVFSQMIYKIGDTPSSLKPQMERLYKMIAPADIIHQVIEHPTCHLAIMITALDEKFIHWSPWMLQFLFIYFGFQRLFSDSLFQPHAKRLCFYTGPIPHLLTDSHASAIQFYKLTADNMDSVLHATTAIPYIQEQCKYIPGYGKGLFLDGAFTDFMINIKLQDKNHPALLLSDFPNGIVKGSILDSFVSFGRCLTTDYFQNCSIICPSPTFIENLIDKCCPSVADWFRPKFIIDPQSRINKWEHAYNQSLVIQFNALFISKALFPNSWSIKNIDARESSKRTSHAFARILFVCIMMFLAGA